MSKKRKQKQPTVSDRLREAIRASSKSPYRIAADTGVDKGVLSRFLRKERGITNATMDTLCQYLHLELRESKQKGA